jgi:hypothetical protein
MVASRKPAPKPKKSGERRPGESLEEMFQRLLVDQDERPLSFTLAEARYVGRRIAETPNPDPRTGNEVMAEFYGDWSQDTPSD